MRILRYLIDSSHGRTKPASSRLSFLLMMLLLIGALVLLAAGCGEQAETAGTDAPASTASTSTTAQPLDEEFMKWLAVRKIGDDPKLVRAATITQQGDSKQLTFKIGRPETCHDGAVVGIGVTFSQKVMAQLFKYPEVSSIEVLMYGTDTTGPALDELALRVMVDRATAQGMDWFQFTEERASQLATEYWAHPKIQTSYNLEGGDPSGPKPQTTPAPAPAPAI